MAVWNDCAGAPATTEASTPAAAEAAHAAISSGNRSAGTFIRRILPAIPKLAWRRCVDPGAYVTRRPICFTQKRDAFFGKRNAGITPFSLRDLSWFIFERGRE